MDLQGAAVLYLLGISEVVNAVGKFPISNKPFIFRDEMLVNLEEGQYSAISAIVVEDAGPVASLVLSSYRGRRLRVTIWANGNRDQLGNFNDPKSVRLKIDDTFKIVDKYLHRKDPEIVNWSGVYTVSCDRSTDLSEPIAIIDGDGIMIATVYYTVYF
jgi:hypothetical protein